MAKRVGIVKARRTLSELLRSVIATGEPVELTSHGKTVAWLVRPQTPIAPPSPAPELDLFLSPKKLERWLLGR